jgi:hypothetical protein
LAQEDSARQKLGPGNFSKGPPIDGHAAIRASIEGGPEGALQFMVQTAPRGMQLTDMWRNYETAMMVFALSKGDIAGVQHARDLALQMSQQGATANLMAADQAIIAGDGRSAAQYLAKAHAFFPDGTIGRFAVDEKGNVWGQRYDEHDPNRALGKPFPVTHESLVPKLIQTRDPMQYLKMVQEQQKLASTLRLNTAHTQYYQKMPEVRERANEINEETRLANVKEREQYHQDSVAQRDEAARLASEDRRLKLDQMAGEERKGAQTQARQADKESSDIFGPAGTSTIPEEAKVNAARIYAELRNNSPTGTMPPLHAQSIAEKLATNKYKPRPQTDGQGNERFAVVDPGDPDTPLAYISSSLGRSLVGSRKINKDMRGSPIGATRNPNVTPNLSSAALPVQ